MSEQVQKAWSTFVVKSVDEDLRIIKGIASTPDTDLVGDIVESTGAQYKLPLPLLAQHDHDQPIGHVTSVNVTSKGIEIEAQISKDSGLGYVEKAWKQIKAGLLGGLSIGFKPLEAQPIKSGGIRYLKWLWYELSAVTIPANSASSITAVKKFDEQASEDDQLVMQMKAHDARTRAAAAIQKANNAILYKRKI